MVCPRRAQDDDDDHEVESGSRRPLECVMPPRSVCARTVPTGATRGDGEPPAGGEAGHSPDTAALSKLPRRLEELRRLGRVRRLRVQLPLGLAAGIVSIGGLCLSIGLGWWILGAIGVVLGPWLLLLCVMPGDRRLIGLALGLGATLMLTSLALLVQSLLYPCHPQRSERSCLTSTIVASYGMSILVIHVAVVARLGCKLWLGSLPPCAALTRTWRCLGSVLILSGLMCFVFAAERLRESATTSVNNEAEASTPIAGQASAIRAALGVECVVLGYLARWPRLRTYVQARLVSMGEGVAAAAGIAEMLAYTPPSLLIADTKRTLRSVRLDKLQQHHLDVSCSSHAAYAISAPAQLGSIDAFVSHSWHDPLDEKWELLQAWRRSFVQANGREPYIWLDRCCLRASNMELLLPCLPIFCAACEKLVALRGPTYLSRTWCAIEMYFFYEMATDVSRIEILSMASAPAYTSLGIRLAPESMRATQSQLFDVRKTTCTEANDLERFLVVIESCGTGFETFNAWMHGLLVEHEARLEGHSGDSTSITPSLSSARSARWAAN